MKLNKKSEIQLKRSEKNMETIRGEKIAKPKLISSEKKTLTEENTIQDLGSFKSEI